MDSNIVSSAIFVEEIKIFHEFHTNKTSSAHLSYLSTDKISSVILICDMIKGNESPVGKIQF